jgi:hydrogenase maturation protein HypF
MYKAIRIVVSGLVQGVGFRPAIHRAAVYAGVKGYVKNLGGSEVEIFIEGEEAELKRFMDALSQFLPPLSIIEEVQLFSEGPRGFEKFVIEKSGYSKVKRSMIPPDIAICEHCLREVLDPRDRRYRYPFNSCAWCGPRYSMMYRVPYDRENTSMRKYLLCPECRREYEDINNIRRYHAQGISCPNDGPKLHLYTSDGEEIDSKDPIKDVAKLIDEGYIVAIKGIGGYHIASLATDDDVVLLLRKRKKRPTQPFAIMALDLNVASRLVYFAPPSSVDILTSPQRPIVLLPKREDSPVSPYVSPGMDVEGVFLPYTALHYLLLMEVKDKFLIMTSGNLHGLPMCRTEECVFTKLKHVVDYVLAHDRDIVNRVDDSVIRFTDGEAVMLRRGRGYAPAWIRVPFKLSRDVIAMGAELQTTAAVGFDDKVVLTPYAGDLDNVETIEEFDEMLEFLIRNYDILWSKAAVVVDKHPEYMSRKLAYEKCEIYGCNVMEIQHHVAHVLSTLADRGISLENSVVGIAMDGTGYGDDGTLWGGEIIMVKPEGYSRVGSLEHIPITSERDIIYPARLVIAILSKIFGAMALEVAKNIPSLSLSSIEEAVVVKNVIENRYTPSSSVGRFLDAVSALLGVCTYRSYEGEPAIRLEAIARGGKLIEELQYMDTIYRDVPRIDILSYIKKLIETIQSTEDFRTQQERVRDIAFTVQIALGKALGKIALKSIYGKRNVEQFIVIGGGAAVNSFILRGIREVLSDEDIKVLLPKKVPPNDGGIALGQVYAYYLFGESNAKIM